jgi:hypothetical protein
MNVYLNTLTSLYQFVRKPNYTINKQRYSFKEKTTTVLLLAIIGILFSSILVVPHNSGLIDASFDENVIRAISNRYGPLFLYIIVVIASPVIEEWIFRYHLKFITGSAVFYLSVVSILTTTILVNVTDRQHVSLFLYLVLCLMVAVLVFIIPKLKTVYKYRKFFIRYYPYHIWLSAFLFSFIHIFNYNIHSNISIILSPLLVLPQLIGGVILSFVRLKFGIGYSILMHVLNNAILLGLILPFQ